MNSVKRNPNDIVISLIPIGIKTMPDGKRAPDLAIVTGAWGESFKSAARLAIYVYQTDAGKLEFANGVFATQIDCITVTMHVGWPELEKQLSKKPKVWSQLFNARDGHKPHTAVKNIYMGDVSDTLGEPEYGPAEALVVLGSWNCWEKKNLNSAARRGDVLDRIVGDSRLKQENMTNVNALTSATNRFDKFCSELGLRRGIKVPTTHWEGLENALHQTIGYNRKALGKD